MDQRDRIPMPTEAEKARAIGAILEAGLSQAVKPGLRPGQMLCGLPLSALFFGVGDCLFLAALLTALCLIPAAAAVSLRASLAALLFLLSPLLYASLQLLTMWKDAASGTLEWKQTCRVSLRKLTALRMLLFGGANLAGCVPMNVLLWSVSGRQLTLPWMLGLSFASLFLYAGLSLLFQRLRRRGALLAAPLLWGLLGLFLLCCPRAAALLPRVPAAALFLLAAAGLAFCLRELNRHIQYPREGGIPYAVR